MYLSPRRRCRHPAQMRAPRSTAARVNQRHVLQPERIETSGLLNELVRIHYRAHTTSPVPGFSSLNSWWACWSVTGVRGNGCAEAGDTQEQVCELAADASNKKARPPPRGAGQQ